MSQLLKKAESAAVMSPPKLRVEYKCYFCRESLKPIAPSIGERLLTLAGVRHLYCPHCFEVKLRPWGWLKVMLWPFVFVSRCLKWVVGRD